MIFIGAIISPFIGNLMEGYRKISQVIVALELNQCFFEPPFHNKRLVVVIFKSGKLSDFSRMRKS